MIRTRNDLKYYLSEDNKQFGSSKPGWRDRILHNERWYVYRFKYELRHVEYYMNSGKSFRLYWHYFYLRI